MGEMEKRKALVLVMAIVLIVLAALTLALTTTRGGRSHQDSHPIGASFVAASSLHQGAGPVPVS